MNKKGNVLSKVLIVSVALGAAGYGVVKVFEKSHGSRNSQVGQLGMGERIARNLDISGKDAASLASLKEQEAEREKAEKEAADREVRAMEAAEQEAKEKEIQEDIERRQKEADRADSVAPQLKDGNTANATDFEDVVNSDGGSVLSDVPVAGLISGVLSGASATDAGEVKNEAGNEGDDSESNEDSNDGDEDSGDSDEENTDTDEASVSVDKMKPDAGDHKEDQGSNRLSVDDALDELNDEELDRLIKAGAFDDPDNRGNGGAEGNKQDYDEASSFQLDDDEKDQLDDDEEEKEEKHKPGDNVQNKEDKKDGGHHDRLDENNARDVKDVEPADGDEPKGDHKGDEEKPKNVEKEEFTDEQWADKLLNPKEDEVVLPAAWFKGEKAEMKSYFPYIKGKPLKYLILDPDENLKDEAFLFFDRALVLYKAEMGSKSLEERKEFFKNKCSVKYLGLDVDLAKEYYCISWDVSGWNQNGVNNGLLRPLVWYKKDDERNVAIADAKPNCDMYVFTQKLREEVNGKEYQMLVICPGKKGKKPDHVLVPQMYNPVDAQPIANKMKTMLDDKGSCEKKDLLGIPLLKEEVKEEVKEEEKEFRIPDVKIPKIEL